MLTVAAQNVIAEEVADDLATAQNCAEDLLLELEDELLTREEKIALLDKVLLQTLSNFDPCGVNVSGDGNDGDGNDGDGDGSDDDGNDAAAVVESVPVGDIQGDLPVTDAADNLADNPPTDTPPTPVTGAEQSPQPTDSLPNGAAPADIPPAENDDIIAKQFRQAALDETDPVAKAKLWNEYRRYKNLPVKEVPES